MKQWRSLAGQHKGLTRQKQGTGSLPVYAGWRPDGTRVRLGQCGRSRDSVVVLIGEIEKNVSLQLYTSTRFRVIATFLFVPPFKNI